MQRSCEPVKKRQIGTQVKIDSTKTINHQQTHVCSFEYTIQKKVANQATFFIPQKLSSKKI
ncbi:MAG: hypothetical protein EGR88_03460 [Ruminococcus sp. SR1/5]|nr:hypothetical protein [Ruminococcus sp.]